MAFSSIVAAQDYPTRPITIVVGFPPGGGTDAPTRLLADKMRASLGVPVIVDNKPGAAQLIAVQAVRGAKPDGYTFLVGTGSSLVQNPALDPKVPYDPINDFVPVALFGKSDALVAVPSSSQFKTLREVIDYAQKHPGELRFGSAGIGTVPHLVLGYLSSKIKFDVIHIPYRGDAAATVDLAEGRLEVGMPSVNTVAPFLATGKLRFLATTSNIPLPSAPDVPSIASILGPDFAVLSPHTFYGLVAPKGTPAAIVAKINAAVNEATRSPELMSTFRERLYTEPVTMSPEEFTSFIKEKYDVWRAQRGKFEISDQK